jgi:hypothetical protein
MLILVDKKEINNISLNKDALSIVVNSIDAKRPTGYKVRVKKKNSIPSNILDKYKE